MRLKQFNLSRRIVHTYSLRAQEVEAKMQGFPQLHSDLGASLDYLTPVSKTTKERLNLNFYGPIVTW